MTGAVKVLDSGNVFILMDCQIWQDVESCAKLVVDSDTLLLVSLTSLIGLEGIKWKVIRTVYLFIPLLKILLRHSLGSFKTANMI